MFLLILKVIWGENNTVLLVYIDLPWPLPDSRSIDSLADILSLYLNFEIIVMGYLNLDWLSDAPNYLKEVRGSLSLCQLVTNPTRSNPGNYKGSALIDLIFSSKCNRISACGVFYKGISNHCPTVCVRSMQMPKSISLAVKRRNFNNFDSQAFLNDLVFSNIHSIVQVTDVQVVTDTFVKTL